ncbi:hypothetical protein TCEA9_11020 [Thermobrachium celere]|nr:hypothetical protein TCEA9_11020 [Thermobrachium celere]
MCISTLVWLLLIGATGIIAFMLGYFIRKNISEKKIQSAEELAKKNSF